MINDPLRFTQHPEVCGGIDVRAGGDVRTTKNNRSTASLRTPDQPQAVGLLEEHAPSHDQIGPVEIGILERLRIAIDEADRPTRREHRSQRNQTQGNGGIACAEQFRCDGVVPERTRAESGVDHEHIAARRFRHLTITCVRRCTGQMHSIWLGIAYLVALGLFGWHWPCALRGGLYPTFDVDV